MIKDKLKNIFEKFGIKSSVFNTFCKYFIVQLIIFTLVVAIAAGYMIHKLKEEVSVTTENRIQTFENMADVFMGQAERIASSLSISDDVNIYLYGKTFDTSKEKNLQKQLINYKSTVKYIDSIYLYSSENNLICTTETWCRNKTECRNFKDYDFLNGLADYGYDNDTAIVSRKIGGVYPQCISLIKKAKVEGGYAVVNINYEKLISIIDNLYDEPPHISALDSEKQFVFSDGINVFSSINEGILKWNKKDNIIYSVVSVGHFNQYFGFADNINSYSEQKLGIMINSIMILIGFLLISIIIAGFFSMPLLKIHKTLQGILDDEQIDISEITDTEDKEIFLKIIALIDENNDFRISLDKRLAEYKTAQMTALQKQINPHFLNNILSTISYKIVEKEGTNALAVKMIVRLTRIIRYGFDTDNSMVALKDELRFIEAYIELLKVGYGDFDFKINISDEMFDCPIIRMSIQPLVENAVYYGVRSLREAGKIEVSVSSTDEKIMVSVWNNGAGIDDKKLLQINEYIQTGEGLQSQGLYNTYSRMKMLYGDECGLWLESDGKSWTCVHIEYLKRDFTERNNK